MQAGDEYEETLTTTVWDNADWLIEEGNIEVQKEILRLFRTFALDDMSFFLV